jgi:hypothetical protein
VGPKSFFCTNSDPSDDRVIHVEAKAVDTEAKRVETKFSSAMSHERGGCELKERKRK